MGDTRWLHPADKVLVNITRMGRSQVLTSPAAILESYTTVSALLCAVITKPLWVAILFNKAFEKHQWAHVFPFFLPYISLGTSVGGPGGLTNMGHVLKWVLWRRRESRSYIGFVFSRGFFFQCLLGLLVHFLIFLDFYGLYHIFHVLLSPDMRCTPFYVIAFWNYVKD